MKTVSKILLIFSFFLAGCTTTTTFETVQSDVSLRINEKASFDVSGNTSRTYATTSFGQFKFKAEKEGMEPMYGIMPLKFNGGYLTADILFFAPAMFYNLREVFPYYQFDVEKKEVRYKKRESDGWMIYKPKPEEVEHAKAYFGVQ
ncbi:hypothetical protein [Marinibactrum halimedae]|nr:hypothetical protein [Marinibactrum halimedae]MCD9458118.1 hypothetical protein [Marinibactrum halimedae]